VDGHRKLSASWYNKCINGCGGNISVSKHHKTFWKNFKRFWRSKSKCQNESSFRVHKKRTFVIEHNRMALTKREYQWNCAEKSRAAAWTPKTNGNTASKPSKIQAMYWKHHGRLHTVYRVVWCVLRGSGLWTWNSVSRIEKKRNHLS